MIFDDKQDEIIEKIREGIKSIINLNESMMQSKEEEIDRLEKELKRYKDSYILLIDYFKYIPDDAKSKLDEQLNKLNL